MLTFELKGKVDAVAVEAVKRLNDAKLPRQATFIAHELGALPAETKHVHLVVVSGGESDEKAGKSNMRLQVRIERMDILE